MTEARECDLFIMKGACRALGEAAVSIPKEQKHKLRRKTARWIDDVEFSSCELYLTQTMKEHEFACLLLDRIVHGEEGIATLPDDLDLNIVRNEIAKLANKHGIDGVNCAFG